MRHKIQHYLLLSVLFIAVGCSSNPSTLDRETLKANKISIIDLQSPQKFAIQKSRRTSTNTFILGGLANGLLNAGIDAAVNGNRADVFAPILAAMGDYNVRDVFTAKLKQMSGDTLASTITVNNIDKTQESEAGVLNLRTMYTLQPNHQAVRVDSLVKLRLSEGGTLYNRQFTALSDVDFGELGNRKISATNYLISNPDKLKAAIEGGMDNVIAQIEHGLNDGSKR